MKRSIAIVVFGLNFVFGQTQPEIRVGQNGPSTYGAAVFGSSKWIATGGGAIKILDTENRARNTNPRWR